MGDVSPLSRDAYDRVRDGVLRRMRRRRRRRDVLVGTAVGVGVTALVGAGALVVAAPEQTRDRAVWCFPEADLSAVPAEGRRSMTDSPTDTAQYAVSFCAALWQAGVVGGAGATAPALDLCVRNDGTYVVLPRQDGDERSNVDFCAALSLAPDPRT